MKPSYYFFLIKDDNDKDDIKDDNDVHRKFHGCPPGVPEMRGRELSNTQSRPSRLITRNLIVNYMLLH